MIHPLDDARAGRDSLSGTVTSTRSGTSNPLDLYLPNTDMMLATSDKGQMGRGNEWRKLSLATRCRDGNRCQICGDAAPIQYSPYGSPHAHHIIPRSLGGPDSLGNTITLCDLCHGVLHPHLWPSWFPQVRSADEDLRRKTLQGLLELKEDYDWFCHLPPDERRRVQDEVWATFGIGRG